MHLVGLRGLGLVRYHALDEAAGAFIRQPEIADAHGLALWNLRATHELGAVDLMRANDAERLRFARQLATASGALSTVATIDLQLAVSSWLALDAQGCLDAAGRCEHAARRWRLELLLAEALMMEAAAHGIGGGAPRWSRCSPRASTVGRPEPEVQAAAYSTRGLAALARGFHR